MSQEDFERFARAFLAGFMVLIGVVILVAAWKIIF